MNVFRDQQLMLTAYGNTTDKVNPEQAKLYFDLMIEEFCETFAALNKDDPVGLAKVQQAGQLLRETNSVAKAAAAADNHEVLDGLTDLKVVTLGAGYSLNFPLHEAWNVVWESNMSKTDPETGMVIKNAAGKVQKPPHYEPAGPKLESMLKLHRAGLLPRMPLED